MGSQLPAGYSTLPVNAQFAWDSASWGGGWEDSSSELFHQFDGGIDGIQQGADIAAASWDSVIFDLGGDSLVRIPTLEPLRGSKAHVGALLDSVDTAVELVEQLTT